MNPDTITPKAISALIIEEIYDSQAWSSWGVFNTQKIEPVKRLMDEISGLLKEENDSIIYNTIKNSLMYFHNTHNNKEIAQLAFPYVDAYDFWNSIAKNEEVRESTRQMAKGLCKAIDEFVVYSYHGNGYFPTTNRFVKNKSGCYQIIPLGKKRFTQTGSSFWAHTTWFHPHDRSMDNNTYGRYDWCSDGAKEGNNEVDNFFEYLDFLFDESNNETGGVNQYRW